jgi:hypothetical protein
MNAADAEPLSLMDLPRNDVVAAVRYYEQRGEIHPDEMEFLLMLQDDARELRRAARRWRFLK